MRGVGAFVAVQAPQESILLYFLPHVLPARWQVIEVGLDGGAYGRLDGLKVIVTASIEEDGRRWLHVSCSRAARLPSWDDLADVKALFVGPDRYAYQVFAPASKHVNIMPHCLHLWACLSHDSGAALPDFTRGGDTI